MDKTDKASELFKNGYNCSQSVFCTFCEDLDFSFEQGLKLTSSFGGGMGKLREVCGAVTAMFMIAGLKYGYTSNNDDSLKAEHYKLIQTLASKFKEKHGSIICRELLNIENDGYIPSKRTKEYYKIRPCEKFITDAVSIIQSSLFEV